MQQNPFNPQASEKILQGVDTLLEKFNLKNDIKSIQILEILKDINQDQKNQKIQEIREFFNDNQWTEFAISFSQLIKPFYFNQKMDQQQQQQKQQNIYIDKPLQTPEKIIQDKQQEEIESFLTENGIKGVISMGIKMKLENLIKIYSNGSQNDINEALMIIQNNIKESNYPSQNKFFQELLYIKNNLERFNQLQKQTGLDSCWLIELMKECNQNNQQIRDKNCLMFFGVTGAGKSTTINSLMGENAVLEKIKIDDLFKEVISYQNQIANIGHSQKSCTFLVHGYEFIQNKTKYLILDTPGIKDSRGIEIDIANNLSISLALQTCNSIIPVLVFNIRDIQGGRAYNFKHTIDMLCNLIQQQTFIEEILESTICIFTHAKQDEMKSFIQPTILQILNETKKDLKEQPNKDQKKVLEYFIKVLQNLLNKITSEEAFIYDPLRKESKSKFLKVLTKKKFIGDLEQKFKVTISTEADTKIKLMDSKIVRIIENRCRDELYDQKNIQFYLNLLYDLKEQTDLDIIKDDYNNSKCKVIDNIDQQWNQLIMKYRNQIMAIIDQDLIVDLFNFYAILGKVEKYQKDHFEKCYLIKYESNKFLDEIIATSEKEFKQLQQSFEEMENHYENNNNLNLQEIQDDFENISEAGIDNISINPNQPNLETSREYFQNNFLKIKQFIENIVQIIDIMPNKYNKQDQQQQFQLEEHLTFLERKISENKEQYPVQKLFNIYKYQERKIQEFQKNLDSLKDKAMIQILQALKNQFQKIIRKISEIFKQSDQKDIKQLSFELSCDSKNIFNLLQLVKNVLQKEKYEESINQIKQIFGVELNRIQDSFQKQLVDLIIILDSFQKQLVDEKKKFEELKRVFIILKTLSKDDFHQCLLEEIKKTFNICFEQIELQIKKQFDQINEELKDSQIGRGLLKELKKNLTIISNLISMDENLNSLFEKDYKKINQRILDCIAQMKKDQKQQFQQFEKLFVEESINQNITQLSKKDQLQKLFRFLQIWQNLKWIDNDQNINIGVNKIQIRIGRVSRKIQKILSFFVEISKNKFDSFYTELNQQHIQTSKQEFIVQRQSYQNKIKEINFINYQINIILEEMFRDSEIFKEFFQKFLEDSNIIEANQLQYSKYIDKEINSKKLLLQQQYRSIIQFPEEFVKLIKVQDESDEQKKEFQVIEKKQDNAEYLKCQLTNDDFTSLNVKDYSKILFTLFSLCDLTNNLDWWDQEKKNNKTAINLYYTRRMNILMRELKNILLTNIEGQTCQLEKFIINLNCLFQDINGLQVSEIQQQYEQIIVDLQTQKKNVLDILNTQYQNYKNYYIKSLKNHSSLKRNENIYSFLEFTFTYLKEFIKDLKFDNIQPPSSIIDQQIEEIQNNLQANGELTNLDIRTIKKYQQEKDLRSDFKIQINWIKTILIDKYKEFIDKLQIVIEQSQNILEVDVSGLVMNFKKCEDFIAKYGTVIQEEDYTKDQQNQISSNQFKDYFKNQLETKLKQMEDKLEQLILEIITRSVIQNDVLLNEISVKINSFNNFIVQLQNQQNNVDIFKTLIGNTRAKVNEYIGIMVEDLEFIININFSSNNITQYLNNIFENLSDNFRKIGIQTNNQQDQLIQQSITTQDYYFQQYKELSGKIVEYEKRLNQAKNTSMKDIEKQQNMLKKWKHSLLKYNILVVSMDTGLNSSKIKINNNIYNDIINKAQLNQVLIFNIEKLIKNLNNDEHKNLFLNLLKIQYSYLDEQFINSIDQILDEDTLCKIQTLYDSYKQNKPEMNYIKFNKNIIDQKDIIRDFNYKYIKDIQNKIDQMHGQQLYQYFKEIQEMFNSLQKDRKNRLLEQLRQIYIKKVKEQLDQSSQDLENSIEQMNLKQRIQQDFEFYSNIILRNIYFYQIHQEIFPTNENAISLDIYKSFLKKCEKDVDSVPIINNFWIFGVLKQLIQFYQQNPVQNTLSKDLLKQKDKYLNYLTKKLKILEELKSAETNIESLILEKINKQVNLSKINDLILEIVQEDEIIYKCLENTPEIKDLLQDQKSIKKLRFENLLQLISNKVKVEIEQMENLLEQQDFNKYFILMDKIRDFSSKLSDIKEFIESKINFKLDYNLLAQKHSDYFKKKQNEMMLALQQEDFDQQMNEATIIQLNINISRLIKAAKTFTGQQQQAPIQLVQAFDQFEKKLQKQITQSFDNIREKNISDNKNEEKVVEYLIRVQKFADNFQPLKSIADQQITQQLSLSATNLQDLQNLQSKLSKTDVGQFIISNNVGFKIIQNIEFENKIQTQDLEYTLENFGSNDPQNLNKENLKLRYQIFDESFLQNRKQFIGNINGLISQIKKQFEKAQFKTQPWKRKEKDNIAKYLGEIFALWSLLQGGGDDQINLNSENQQSIPISKPHYSQIMSIFVLQSLDQNNEKYTPFSNQSINNALNEIKTGEGKSITLGITSILLALLGFNVYVVSYSRYLSQRDYVAFSNLFQMLGIIANIRYGTFQDLCREMIDQEVNVRSNTLNLVLDQCKIPQSKVVESKNSQFFQNAMILIDEVDVFFTEDFYANVYSALTLFKDKLFENLIWDIWCNRKDYQGKKNNELFQKAQTEHPELFKKFKPIEDILELNIIQMVEKLKDIDTHQFELAINPDTNKTQVAYIIQDSLNFQQSYGYLTTWAYAKSVQQNRISYEIFSENVGLYIKCGSFSYAKMITPEKFKIIQGVTGTLKQVSPSIKTILKNSYKISKEYYCPSMFGKSQLIWSEKVNESIFLEETKEDFFFKIIQLKNSKRKENQILPILVIFENEYILKEFEKSALQKSWLKDKEYQILLASVEFSQKEKIVRNATKMNGFTMMTREFGRGTDFKCYDQVALKNGGITIIQTFLSKDINEEIQIQGRVARQGDQGYYYLVLDVNDPQLNQFIQIKDQQIIDADETQRNKYKKDLMIKKKMEGDIYKFLNEQRNNFYQAELQKFQEKLDICQAKHQESSQYLEKLRQNNKVEAFQFVLKWNSQTIKPLHFLILIDDSGSMSGQRWDNAVNAAKIFIKDISAKFRTSHLTLMQFGSGFVVKQSFEQIKPDQGDKFQFRSGGTEFDPVLLASANLIEQNKAQCQKAVILFYTDGGASYPTTAVNKFKALQQNKIDVQIFLICESSQSCLNQMVTDLKNCKIQTSVTPQELGNTLATIAESIGEGQL